MIQVDGVHVGDIRPMGEKHIRMRVMDIDAVWWNGRQHTAMLSSGPVSLVGSLATPLAADGRCASLWKMLAFVLRKLLKRLNQVLDPSARRWPHAERIRA